MPEPRTPASRTSAEADLAFLRSIVEGSGRPPMTLAVCYLAGGLLYGLQCLFHVGQATGLIRWPDPANLDLLTLVPVVGVAAGLLGIVVALFGLGGAIMTGFGTDRECGFVTRRFTRRHTGAGGYVPSSVPGHGGDQDDWSGDDSVA